MIRDNSEADIFGLGAHKKIGLGAPRSLEELIQEAAMTASRAPITGAVEVSAFLRHRASKTLAASFGQFHKIRLSSSQSCYFSAFVVSNTKEASAKV